MFPNFRPRSTTSSKEQLSSSCDESAMAQRHSEDDVPGGGASSDNSPQSLCLRRCMRILPLHGQYFGGFFLAVLERRARRQDPPCSNEVAAVSPGPSSLSVLGGRDGKRQPVFPGRLDTNTELREELVGLFGWSSDFPFDRVCLR